MTDTKMTGDHKKNDTKQHTLANHDAKKVGKENSDTPRKMPEATK